MRKLLLSALFILSAFVMPAQTSIKVQTHKVVAENEKFNVSFVIDGKVDVSDFSWDAGSDFQVLWGPQRGHSSSVQIIHKCYNRADYNTYSANNRQRKA